MDESEQLYWDLPEEAITYREAARELLGFEVLQQRRYLKERGISLEPKVARLY